MVNVAKAQLESIFLPGHNPPPQFKQHYQAAYKLWFSAWNDAYKKLGVDPLRFSDNFTRQDEVGALFIEQTCVGLVLYRWVDASLDAVREDSYFKVWSQEDIEHLCQNGDRVLIPSYLTVHPEWRRLSNGQVQTTQLLMDFMVRRFLDSPADAMASTTRNNRGINAIAYKLGAQTIRANVTHFSVEDPVDLVVTYRNKAQTLQELPIRGLAEGTWRSRTYVAPISLGSKAAPEQTTLSKAS